MIRGKKPRWDAAAIKSLREHLSLTQHGLSQELGVRQQTVSEWETGRYEPRGASARMLSMLAEQRAPYDPEGRAGTSA